MYHPRLPLKIFKEKLITFPKLDDEDLEPGPYFYIKKEDIELPELGSKHSESIFSLSIFRQNFKLPLERALNSYGRVVPKKLKETQLL